MLVDSAGVGPQAINVVWLAINGLSLVPMSSEQSSSFGPWVKDMRHDMGHLPLCLLAVDKGLQNADDLVQGAQILLHELVDLGLIVSQLLVEVVASGTGAHGGTEEGLNHKAVVGLEGGAIGVPE